MTKTGDDACKIDSDAVYLCEDGRLDSVFRHVVERNSVLLSD